MGKVGVLDIAVYDFKLSVPLNILISVLQQKQLNCSRMSVLLFSCKFICFPERVRVPRNAVS